MTLDNQQGVFRSSKNGEFLNYTYTEMGIQHHSNHSPQSFELKKQKQTSNIFFVVLLVVAVTHNTFTSLDIPTQDLPSTGREAAWRTLPHELRRGLSYGELL